MSDVPAWKKAILEKKKQKGTEDVQKRKEEEERLAQLPAWKRSLLLKKQEQEGAGKSPPLSRSAFSAKRKDSLLKDQVTTPTSEKQAPSATSPAAPAAKPLASPVSASTADIVTRDRGESVSSVTSDDGSEDRPKVKELLGLFKKKRSDEPTTSSTTPVKQPGSAERKRPAAFSPTSPVSPASKLTSPTSQGATAVSKKPVPEPFKKPLDKPDGSIQTLMTMSDESVETGMEEEEDDVVTNIDDIVVDAKTMAAMSPRRVQGVESMPASPTALSKNGKKAGCLTTAKKEFPKVRRSVSFNQMNLETVHTFEREPNSDDEDEEEEEVPDKATSGGLKSVPSIGKKSDDISGFQTFQPKALADEQTDAVEVPSWRQAPATTKKKKEEPTEEPVMAREASHVEKIDDEPALLW